MIGPVMLAHVSQRLQEAKGNHLPFGGVGIVLVGDAAQLPPVCPPLSLFQGLVHQQVILPTDKLPPKTRYYTYDVDTPAHAGSRLFSKFALLELTEQMRAAEDPVHTAFVNRFRETGRTEHVTQEVLDHIRVLCRADVEADPEWAFAVHVVTTNRERDAINLAQALRFARVHNASLVRWRLPLVGSSAARMSHEDVATLYEEHDVDLFQYFVVGAPGYITDNIGSRIGLANGTFISMHSLTFNHDGTALQRRQAVAAEQAIAATAGGELVTVDVAPLSVNVRVPKSAAEVASWPPELTMVPGAIVVPLLADPRKQEELKLRGTFVGRTVTVQPHSVDLGFAISVWKCQGRTMSKVILSLNQRPAGPHFDFAALFVAFSRVRKGADMRRLPVQSAQSLQYLLLLKPKMELLCWREGFDDSGVWSAAAARGAYTRLQLQPVGSPTNSGRFAARCRPHNAPLLFGTPATPTASADYDCMCSSASVGFPSQQDLEAMADNELTSDRPVPIRNFGNTCWLGATVNVSYLVRWVLWLV